MSSGKAPSYVPGRNTVLLALAQSYAESINADVIFCGVNAVDYSGYVDCRPAFIAAWNDLAGVSTFRGTDGNPIWVEAPLIDMTKVDIVKKGLELGAPLHLTWSCYAGLDHPCNTCDSCIIRNRAFHECGMVDPAVGG
jgi:7-cyano-7-deazaguanine synthase